MKSEQEVNHAIDKYADMIQRICLYRLKNKEDTEDVFQNVFLKYMLYEGQFENEEHEKSWLIRVTLNACKDFFKIFLRKKTVPLEVLAEAVYISKEYSEVLEAVLSLPEKYKDVIYLHYYEGYSAYEIGTILKKKENTVYSLLSRGRGILREILGGEQFEG